MTETDPIYATSSSSFGYDNLLFYMLLLLAEKKEGGRGIEAFSYRRVKVSEQTI